MEDYITVMKNQNNLVEFDNVHTYFFTDHHTVKAVNGVSFDVPKGKIVGIAGESGCGKSVTALSLMQLIQQPQGKTVQGQIRFHTGNTAIDVVKAPAHILQTLRGRQMSMIFQDSFTGLNPVLCVGFQVDEVLRQHYPGMNRKEVKKRTLEAFMAVGIANKEDIYKMYPHELSGGMCQRIMIAMALVCRPQLIIADEPTTSLDVTLQAQILDLFCKMKKETNSSVILISHDLRVIAEIADYVIIMQNGSIVEKGTVKEIFRAPKHPYTIQLLNSGLSPNYGNSENNRNQQENDILLKVSHLKKYFSVKKGHLISGKKIIRAVDDISFTIKRGSTMGLVGESGCGKSTTGLTILKLLEKTAGEVIYNGKDISQLSKKELRRLRPEIQPVFQDSYSSFSPNFSVGQIISEAVAEHKIVSKNELNAYITRIMNACGLPEDYKKRYPHELSGGERQRICIARALALKPEFVICDEPVSALDASTQTQIINLLKDLQGKYHLTYLFISHNLSVIEHISDTVAVMYLGSIVEFGKTADIFNHPMHPYTKTLLSAILVPDIDRKTKRIVLEDDIPSPENPPSGCKFHTRCPKCMEICKTDLPAMKHVGNGHTISCHLY